MRVLCAHIGPSIYARITYITLYGILLIRVSPLIYAREPPMSPQRPVEATPDPSSTLKIKDFAGKNNHTYCVSCPIQHTHDQCTVVLVVVRWRIFLYASNAA